MHASIHRREAIDLARHSSAEFIALRDALFVWLHGDYAASLAIGQRRQCVVSVASDHSPELMHVVTAGQYRELLLTARRFCQAIKSRGEADPWMDSRSGWGSFQAAFRRESGKDVAHHVGLQMVFKWQLPTTCSASISSPVEGVNQIVTRIETRIYHPLGCILQSLACCSSNGITFDIASFVCGGHPR